MIVLLDWKNELAFLTLEWIAWANTGLKNIVTQLSWLENTSKKFYIFFADLTIFTKLC
jgi:hypothetical protein